MVTSLTGSMLLLTDKPERYLTQFVEPAKRTAPVLFTLPGQLYDVDPSRSAELGRVEIEVSGREPKPFDAGLTPGATSTCSRSTGRSSRGSCSGTPAGHRRDSASTTWGSIPRSRTSCSSTGNGACTARSPGSHSCPARCPPVQRAGVHHPRARRSPADRRDEPSHHGRGRGPARRVVERHPAVRPEPQSSAAIPTRCT